MEREKDGITGGQHTRKLRAIEKIREKDLKRGKEKRNNENE